MRNQHTKIHSISARVVAAGLATLALQAGCMTLEQMAPPVGVEFQRVALRNQVEVATLELGRRVYLMDCARCHSVEPIGRYSESHWREILPRMSQETKLGTEEQAALKAYVLAAHSFLSQEQADLVSSGQSRTN